MSAWERLGDVAVVVLIVLFAWLGVQVHNSIAGLAEMARGMQATGTSIQQSGVRAGAEIRRSVSGAADAAEAVPFVGNRVGSALRDTARSTSTAVEREARTTGAQLIASGRDGEREAEATARLVGWLAFLIPTVCLLAQAVPRWVRRWRATEGTALGNLGGAGRVASPSDPGAHASSASEHEAVAAALGRPTDGAVPQVGGGADAPTAAERDATSIARRAEPPAPGAGQTQRAAGEASAPGADSTQRADGEATTRLAGWPRRSGS
jgi:hypothetical protein